MKIKEPFLSKLAPVRRALETWRRTRKPRQPIPETLWMQMAALACAHGVSPVSQALGLDYYALKRRVAEISKVPAPSVSSEFVELKFPASDGASACVAELEDGRGRKLILRWASSPGTQMLGLVQCFLNQGT